MFDSGIAIIRELQQFSPALDIFFKALTFLGDEAFFLVSLPFIYWCLCKRTGARLSVLFLLSAYINMVAKLTAGPLQPALLDRLDRAIQSLTQRLEMETKRVSLTTNPAS